MAEDVEILRRSEHCNVLNAEVQRSKLMFIVGPTLGVRITELHMIKCLQLKEEKVSQTNALVFHGTVDSKNKYI